MGSPPPLGSKNEVLKFRSVSSMVIAPAKTGRDSRSRIAVRRTAHMNSGLCSRIVVRMLMAVVMKFTELRIDDTPAK